MTSVPTVTLNPDRQTYHHAKGQWSGNFPLEQLDSWIAFYRRLSKKYPQHYQQDLKALLIFQKVRMKL